MVMMHYPRCGVCRRVLEYLDRHFSDHKVVHYVLHPPSEAEWGEICRKLGSRPRELLRLDSPLVKTRWGNSELSDEEWLSIVVRYPQLVRRPIVMDDDWAVIPQSPEELATYLVDR